MADSHPHTSLRVAMPLMTLVPGGMGGSETYARELTRGLVDVVGLDVVAMVSAGAAGFSMGVPEVVAERVPGGASTGQRIRTQLQGSFTRSLRGVVTTADVVHYPLSVPVPRPPRGKPFVQTLLDVQHHDLSSLFSRAEREYRRLTYDRPARRADAVITISEFSKRRIVEHLGVDPDRVHVAHLGVDMAELTPHRGPRERFVLYPARGWPHKNHRKLVEAMHLVRERVPDMRLVLTGGGLDELDQLPEWVEKRGLVSREELLRLYRQAACLAFPSRYEGFGLPPLEAMASGCPVAAADAGSLPEICGDAATLFDPQDPSDIARAVLDATSSNGDAQVEAGLRQCRKFTWGACAEVHADVYRAVADVRS
jgi:glycosyltransferase involved in cell wall biosynthesis